MQTYQPIAHASPIPCHPHLAQVKILAAPIVENRIAGTTLSQK